MEKKLITTLFAALLCLLSSIVFGEELNEYKGFSNISGHAAENIVREFGLIATGQVYGATFIAQDSLLHYSRRYNFSDLQWEKLNQNLRLLSNPSIKAPDQAHVAEAWERALKEQIRPEDIAEINRFAKTEAGQRFINSMLYANSKVLNDLSLDSAAKINRLFSDFEQHAESIANSCMCKKK